MISAPVAGHPGGSNASNGKTSGESDRMGHIPSLPSTFRSVQSAEPEAIPIVVRNDLDRSRAAVVIDAVDAVPWSDLCHAYGPADDVREQLIAITVEDDATLEVAWWNLVLLP